MGWTSQVGDDYSASAKSLQAPRAAIRTAFQGARFSKINTRLTIFPAPSNGALTNAVSIPIERYEDDRNTTPSRSKLPTHSGQYAGRAAVLSCRCLRHAVPQVSPAHHPGGSDAESPPRGVARAIGSRRKRLTATQFSFAPAVEITAPRPVRAVEARERRKKERQKYENHSNDIGANSWTVRAEHDGPRRGRSTPT